jgi:hypothetical protein
MDRKMAEANIRTNHPSTTMRESGGKARKRAMDT